MGVEGEKTRSPYTTSSGEKIATQRQRNRNRWASTSVTYINPARSRKRGGRRKRRARRANTSAAVLQPEKKAPRLLFKREKDTWEESRREKLVRSTFPSYHEESARVFLIYYPSSFLWVRRTQASNRGLSTQAKKNR